MRYVWTLLAVASSLAPATAAPPTLAGLFPPGGQRGQMVVVTATGTFTRWPVKAWCDSPKIIVTPDKKSGHLTFAIGADVIPGVYWVRLHNEEGASELRPFLVSNLPEVPEQEPNDDIKKPQSLPAGGGVINGKLAKPGDVDGFAIALTKGQTLVASLEAQQTLRSPMDGVLQIVSADGFVLAQNDDFHGIDPHLAYVIPKDGTYVVRLFAFPLVADSSLRFAGGEKFNYRLTITTGGVADYALPLAISRSAPTAVETVGWNIPEAARKTAPVLREDPFAVVFHPLLANAVSVRVEPHATISKNGPANRSQPQLIAPPTTISGRLDKPGAIDVYQFPGKKGQKLAIQAEARTLHFPLDPVLRITDSQGKTLAEAQASALNTDPTLNFTVPVDGAYRLEIRDLHGDGGPRYVYRLRAVLAEPDVAFTLASDRFILKPGKPLDIPITIDRRNGFAEEVTFTLAGLADGIVAKIPPAPTSAKTATFKVTAEKATFAGPVRIVGQTKTGMSRVVRANTGEPGLTTEHVWLTVAPAAK